MENLKQIWFEVFSEMYGTTTACVLDIDHAIKIGRCDCGSGEVYHFTRHEIEQFKNGIEHENDFVPSSKLKYPINLIAMLKCDGNRMDLPKNFSFSKKEYTDLKNEIIKSGGIYSKNGFDFIENSEIVYDRITSGSNYNLKKEFQFFGTPEEKADELVSLAEIQPNDSILEPEAGQGAIIRAINKVCDIVPDCFELMDVNKIVLNKSGLKFNLIGDDFLKHNGKLYTKIIANPPFSKNQDIDHILEMYKCLAPNGRLVSMSSESWVDGNQKKQKDFRKWLEDVEAVVIQIEKGTFKESGTMVGGKIIVINKQL